MKIEEVGAGADLNELAPTARHMILCQDIKKELTSQPQDVKPVVISDIIISQGDIDIQFKLKDTKDFNSVATSQVELRDLISIQNISNPTNQSDQENTIATENSCKVPTAVKKSRRQKCNEGQGEYLEKMSVRGLSIQQYQCIIDGVAYCLPCYQNNMLKSFKNKYSFQRHAYLFHEGNNRKIFACPICKTEFSRPDKMKLHKKDKHGDTDSETPSLNVPKISITGKTRNRKTKKSLQHNGECEAKNNPEKYHSNVAMQGHTHQASISEPLFSAGVLPGGAEIHVALGNALNQDHQAKSINNVNQMATVSSNSPSSTQRQYTTLSNVAYLPTQNVMSSSLQNYHVVATSPLQPKTLNHQVPNTIHANSYNMPNLMPTYTINQVQTPNGVQLLLTSAPLIASQNQNITNGSHLGNNIVANVSSPTANAVIKIEPETQHDLNNYIMVSNDQLLKIDNRKSS